MRSESFKISHLIVFFIICAFIAMLLLLSSRRQNFNRETKIKVADELNLNYAYQCAELPNFLSNPWFQLFAPEYLTGTGKLKIKDIFYSEGVLESGQYKGDTPAMFTAMRPDANKYNFYDESTVFCYTNQKTPCNYRLKISPSSHPIFLLEAENPENKLIADVFLTNEKKKILETIDQAIDIEASQNVTLFQVHRKIGIPELKVKYEYFEMVHGILDW